jgi:hypothetical protein
MCINWKISSAIPNDDVRSVMDQRRQRFYTIAPTFGCWCLRILPIMAFQLNMRRKAEILKYDGNRQASKTNNFTRKENWSKIVRGTSSIQTTNYNIDNDLVNSSCMVNNATPMLTTRSNVPGKPIFCITTQRFRFTTTEIKCLTELMRPKLFRKPHCGILLQNSILNFF